MKRVRILIACLFAVGLAQAQDTSRYVHVSAGLLYNSGLNYYGRVDSLKSKGLCPFVGITLKNGLYVNSTFVFIENSQQSQYAATLLEAGYNFKSANNHWAGNLSGSRFFYQQDIALVESAVKEVVSASITELNPIANITLTGSARWSNQVDYNAQAGLDHITRIPNVFSPKGVLVVDPMATIAAGTQNFTTTYYEEKHFLIFPIAQQQLTTSSQQFNILAYEFSCPVVYGLGKLNLMLTPAYVMPQHLLTASETGRNLFYINATAKVTL